MKTLHTTETFELRYYRIGVKEVVCKVHGGIGLVHLSKFETDAQIEREAHRIANVHRAAVRKNSEWRRSPRLPKRLRSAARVSGANVDVSGDRPETQYHSGT